MDCYCHSKDLYKRQYIAGQIDQFQINDARYPSKRLIDQEKINLTHQYSDIQSKIAETAELWIPNQIQNITWNQIVFNPLWFYKKFISKNVPCIISDVLDGDDVYQRWNQPQYLAQILQGQNQSISLTPDGFADSIKGQYFIEPFQQKAPISHLFDRQQRYPGCVPYIQHQNSNLASQFSTLNNEFPQDTLRNISQCFFKGSNPEAENLWLGYDDSVSSLHKDHYQNFYIPIVGEKHFTLLPPHSILYLQEQEYKAAKWNRSKNEGGHYKFKAQSLDYDNKWICVNPDLKQDVERFENLQKASKFHVVVKKEQMLYLPALWYHQVSQTKVKDPYTLAINYWFDMEFTQNFSLYETCRKLRNL